MASCLVTAAALRGTAAITLHCRDGLAANEFWPRVGFVQVGIILGGVARRKIILEWELNVSAALDNAELPYGRHFLDFVARRTQEGSRSGAITPPTRTPCGRTHILEADAPPLRGYLPAACGGVTLPGVGCF